MNSILSRIARMGWQSPGALLNDEAETSAVFRGPFNGFTDLSSDQHLSGIGPF